MKLEYAGLSESGPVRPLNEDAVLMCASPDAGLFLVADGVGGRASGEVVSGRIRDAYRQWWQTAFLPSSGKLNFPDALREIQDTLLHVNRELVQQFGQMNAGSTLALLFLYRGNCACISAGDSRAYRIRGFGLKQITQDDAYQAEDAAHAAQNGKLTSAVGIRTSLQFNLRTDALREGDCFFLCSDGIYRYVRPSVLRRRLCFGGTFQNPERIVGNLKRDVLKNGAGDNYSAVFIRVRRA